MTNMLKRLNEEIKRRTHVVRIFPNGESCLRLVRALAVETHENWLEQRRYLNMDDLHEHKKGALRAAVWTAASTALGSGGVGTIPGHAARAVPPFCARADRPC